jgi:transcription initiation factor TFIID subunit 2
MLEKRLGGNDTINIFPRVLASLFQGLVSSKTGDRDPKAIPAYLSTNQFLKACRKFSSSGTLTTQTEISGFAKQWIHGAGVPRFIFSHYYNRKRGKIEVRFKQENTRSVVAGAHKFAPCEGEYGQQRFTGPFIIRVHEPDGEFDNQVYIQDQAKTFDVPYHTRFKKNKLTTRKVESHGLEAGAEIEEQVDMKSIAWIRFDPDMEWLCVKIYSQQDFQWTSQLNGDKDVIAQHDVFCFN